MVQAVSKLAPSKSVIISVMPAKITLMSDGTGGFRFWCGIKRNAIFSSHTMEGVLATNEFRIETNPVALSKTLKLVNMSSKSLNLRLSKSTGQPVLNVVIEEPAYNTNKNREVSHNIQIQIISRSLYPEYDKQPTPVHVLVDMGRMPELANAARRMKSLAPQVTFTLSINHQSGDRSGSSTGPAILMSLSSGVVGCHIRAVFKNVRLSHQSGTEMCEDPAPNPDLIEIDVDGKLLHQFLNAFRKRNVNLTMGIRVEEYMTFCVSEQEYSMDYLLPCIRRD